MIRFLREKLQKKERIVKGFLLIFCSVLCAVSICGVSTFAAVKEKPSNTIRVGGFPYDGQLDVDKEGNYSGYGFDYLQEVARYTGWHYEFVDATWEESLEMLKTGEIDLMGVVMKSPTREELYDFSDWPMGSGYGILATSLDNETLPYEDFKAFNGLRVGTLKNNQQAENFLAYSRERTFAPTLFYYSTQKELMAALDAGEIEAVAMTSILHSPNLRVVAKFGENDAYFATTKGNTAVLDALNSAMQKIRIGNPYFNSELNHKHFDLQAVTPVSFTREELNYIKNCAPIQCFYDPAARPISYFDENTGEPHGIALDVCDTLGKITGLTFNPVHTDTLAEAADMMTRGGDAIILAKTHEFSWAQKNEMTLTNHYLEGQIVMVTNGPVPEIPVVALYGEFFVPELTKAFEDGTVKLIYYDNVSDCLEAVYKDEADITLTNSIIMSYEGRNPRYSQFSVTQLHGYSANICMAVSNSVDPLLVSILNKALENISHTQINHIVTSNMKTNHFNTLVGVLYTRPIEFVLLIFGLFSIVAFIIFLLFRSRAQSAREMERMLYTDELTGHTSYRALTRDAVELLEQKPEGYALVYINMHQFKAINDTFGYDAGDRILKAISDIFKSFINSDERFARIYADKFVLLLQHTTTNEALLARLDELSTQLEQLSSEEFAAEKFLFSGGICRLQRDFCDLKMAFDRASYAKDTVKDHFTNTFVFYDNVMRCQVLFQKNLESSMQSALEKGEFKTFYQPKVNVITGEVIGVEALVRWQSPEKGLLLPNEFLPFYEKNGFIVRIDFAVFEMVCRDLGNWLKAGENAVPVSVNFSRRHVPDRQFAQKLNAIANQYGVPTPLLEIEITETIALESVERALEFSNALKDFGFQLSIDDYGTGYSSISFLQDLPLDALKLDKEFVSSAMNAQKAKDLMAHLIMAVKNNGIRILCEGIETQEQQDFIVALNCCFAQGYFYAKPMPKEEFEAYLKQHKLAPHHYLDVFSISNFPATDWPNAKNVTRRNLPGWMMGCYISKGYPIFYISPEMLEALGYSEEEFQYMCGGLYVNCVHPDDLPNIVEEMAKSGHQSEECTLQYRLRKKDGGCLWIKDTNRKIVTDDGRKALLCTCTDISDIIKLQQEKESLMDAIPGGICEMLITPEGPIIQHATENFYSVIEQSIQEMEAMGNRFFAVIHHTDLSGVIDTMKHNINTKKAVCDCKFRICGKDGSLHWISMRGKLRSDGQNQQVTAIVYNIEEYMERQKNEEIIRTKLELALTLSNHGVYEYDIKTKRIYEQRGLDAYFPKDMNWDNIPESMIESGLVHPQDGEEFRQMFYQVCDGESHTACDIRVRSVNADEYSQYVWIRMILSTIYDDDGAPIKAIGIVENIDEQKRIEQAYSQEEQYRRALASSAILSYDINLTNDTVYHIVGESKNRIMQMQRSLNNHSSYTQLMRVAAEAMVASEDQERFFKDMGKKNLLQLYRQGVIEKEYEYQRFTLDGKKLWVAAMVHLILDESSGDVLGFVHYRDIQKRKDREESLQYQATRDPLTGLLNRASAEHLIKEFLSKERTTESIHAFLMLDMDEFKGLNDSYGHHFGDKFLIKMASAIKGNLRDSDIVARIGGDEFIILVKNLRDENSAKLIGEKIARSVVAIGKEMNSKIETSVSIGIALVPSCGTDFDTLYCAADKAMYATKTVKTGA